MEFFERAHVTHKKSGRENKPESTVKKQLKQMLHAYKKGSNHEIKLMADTSYNKYDDDIKSLSDYSDISFQKEADTSNETSSTRASAEMHSSIESKSLSSTENSSDRSNIQIENSESASPSLSHDMSTSNKDLSSTFDSSILSEELSDSEISIPSSLQSFSGKSDVTDDEVFDPDGTLANKILQKLNKNMKESKKRKLSKEDPDNKSSSKKEKKKQSTESIPINKQKPAKTSLKVKDFSNAKDFTIKTNESVYREVKDESSCDSFQCNIQFENSQSSENSIPFISVTASDMQSQSLSDIIGDYVHPTVVNLPSVQQNTALTHSGNFSNSDEDMNADNIEDISSLIPEADDELAIEDLTLESNTTQEPPAESTAYDDTVQTEDYFEQESSTDYESAPMSIKVYQSKNNYILVLKHPTELFVHGKVKVSAVGGSVEVFGYTVLQDDSIDMYAPYCSYAQSIKTIENDSSFHGLLSKLLAAGLKSSDTEEIMTMVTENDAVISLSRLNSSKIDFVDNNFSVTDLFSKRVDHIPDLFKAAAESIGCSLYLDQPKKVLEEKTSWEEVVNCGKKSGSRGIICGGKGTGKSTLLRYCVNRLLYNTPVLVIDLDPGQAEFTMPGNISASVVYRPLIGPNFTHLKEPEKMLNIGMINPMDNPARYISAVRELIAFCQTILSFHEIPWLVNTMGMCNNMGLKFISYIILEIQPTFVFQIDSKITKKRFEFELQPHAVSNFYEEHMKQRLFRTEKDPYALDYTFLMGMIEENEAAPQKKKGFFALSPRDERYLNVLAYFGQLLDVYKKNILDIVPYEVDIKDLNIGVNVKIPEQTVTKVINGKIIALCQLAAEDKGKMFTLGDNALSCHGYGLVRSIDFEKRLLYILTPIPIGTLKLVNTLVYTDWMPELLGQERELPRGTVVPYRTATVSQERRLMSSPRRRFNPIQLLKATRSA